jgi:hypothetical protein
VLLAHRLRAAFAALVCGAQIVMHAVEAHLEIGTAALTRFSPARLSGKRVIRPAFVAVPRHKRLK